MAPAEPLVRKSFTHDPEQYDFKAGDLPALYVFRTGSASKPETTAEDIRISTERVRIFWVLPPADQIKQAARSRAVAWVAKLLDTAIQRGRDPSWFVEGDPDESAPYEGSVLLRHAGLIWMEGGQWSHARIAIKPIGGLKSQPIDLGVFDGLQTEIIIKERLRELPGANVDHPEWGPHAGNDLIGPAQLELSINGTAAATFLVGFTMLYISEETASQSISTTPAKFTGFDGAGNAAGTVPDAENDKITVESEGNYNVVAALSVSGTDGVQATLKARKNGVELAGLRGDVTLSASIQNLALIGQAGIDQGDVLELYVEGDGSGSLTAASGTFAVTRI